MKVTIDLEAMPHTAAWLGDEDGQVLAYIAFLAGVLSASEVKDSDIPELVRVECMHRLTKLMLDISKVTT